MATRRVTITALNGGHARPVAELVRLAMDHDDPVVVRKDTGAEADLRSVLAVMMLDLRNTNALMFKNSASGELNMVYRRDDGNIGWVEPPAR